MMNELVKLLDENLFCTNTNTSTDSIHFYVESTRKECTCPFCQTVSSRIHSRYKRFFQDLPTQSKKYGLRYLIERYFVITHYVIVEHLLSPSPL